MFRNFCCHQQPVACQKPVTVPAPSPVRHFCLTNCFAVSLKRYFLVGPEPAAGAVLLSTYNTTHTSTTVHFSLYVGKSVLWDLASRCFLQHCPGTSWFHWPSFPSSLVSGSVCVCANVLVSRTNATLNQLWVGFLWNRKCIYIMTRTFDNYYVHKFIIPAHGWVWGWGGLGFTGIVLCKFAVAAFVATRQTADTVIEEYLYDNVTLR